MITDIYLKGFLWAERLGAPLLLLGSIMEDTEHLYTYNAHLQYIDAKQELGGVIRTAITPPEAPFVPYV